jgi:hypothetical protein
MDGVCVFLVGVGVGVLVPIVSFSIRSWQCVQTQTLVKQKKVLPASIMPGLAACALLPDCQLVNGNNAMHASELLLQWPSSVLLRATRKNKSA